MSQAGIAGRRQPLVLLTYIVDSGIVSCDCFGLIGRSIVDNDDFIRMNRLAKHAFNRMPQKPGMFVTGNDDADEIQEIYSVECSAFVRRCVLMLARL